MQSLVHYIFHDWPPTKDHLPQQLQAFWHFREELSIADGILLKATRAIVPPLLCPSMLTKIHHSHRGPEYCLCFARDVVFWPNISKDIEEFCHSCSTCTQYGKQAAAKPMLSHPIPTLPWQFVSQDIFAFGHKQYLMTVDHYSDFYELDERPITPPPTQPQQQEQQISETPVVHVNRKTTRSGQVVRLPQKYKDFVLS